MLTGIVLLLLGSVMLLLAITTFVKYKKMTRTGITTEGIVCDIEKVQNSRSGYFPIIQFTTANGISITKIYKISVTRKFYEKGSKVDVIYDPNNPDDFFIKSSYSFFGPIALAFFSLLIITVGILVFLRIKFP